jgi:hypothetical protein
MVTTCVDGVAASIASVIAMAGDRVVMMPNSQLMIHDGSGLCVGDAQDMRDMADLLDKQSDNIASIYRDKAGGLAKTWRSRMKAETWYSAEEAVKAGLADEVAKQPARRSEQMSNQWDLTMFRYAGRDQAPPPPLTNEDQPPEEPEEPEGMPMTDTAVPVHHTPVAEQEWDGGEAERRLPSPMSVATARRVYTWYDPEQVEDGMLPKQAAKLPHHEVSADGTPGAANLPAVRNALARLPQSDIPASDREAIREHLQAHLDDGRETEAEGQAPTTDSMDAAWSPDVFRAAMSKATEVLPDDFTDIFRNAVAAAAGTAAAPARKAAPEPDPDSLGWRPAEPPAPERETARGIFHNAIATAAGSAAAIPGRPDPAPDPASLGWGAPAPDPEPVPESFARLFHDAVAREANHAPAVVTKPTPEPEPDHYDPMIIARALREATQQ